MQYILNNSLACNLGSSVNKNCIKLHFRNALHSRENPADQKDLLQATSFMSYPFFAILLSVSIFQLLWKCSKFSLVAVLCDANFTTWLSSLQTFKVLMLCAVPVLLPTAVVTAVPGFSVYSMRLLHCEIGIQF